VSRLHRASPAKVGRECKLGRARLRRPHFVMSSESRDIPCYFSYKKIRDSSTALGMTKRARARRTCTVALASAFLSGIFPGRARLRRAGCKRATAERSRNRDRNFPKPKSYSSYRYGSRLGISIKPCSLRAWWSAGTTFAVGTRRHRCYQWYTASRKP
jgi:hypothetical protein